MAKKPQSDAADRVIDALMNLAAERAWATIELADIAARAELTLAELRDVTPSKGAILAMFARRIDRLVLAGATNDLAAEPTKDRVFDVLMRRFDALAPYREALRGIKKGLRGDPLALAAMNGVALNSMRYMLASAGVETEGPLGALKVQGGVLTLARVRDVWLDDDSDGLSKTMAALDRELVRGGRVLAFAEDMRRMTAPLRALACAVLRTGERVRERARAKRPPPGRDDEVVSV